MDGSITYPQTRGINGRIHRQNMSGSDTSGSGRTTICLTVRPDFVCQKTVTKSIVKREIVQTDLRSYS
ncbi:putative HTH-type transcriptional regulator YdeC [Trichinella spiralis]|uniref:HTH-type transcriptional regulator YdeC n=1 Tax=Trichinella spiralis TaxID=6334 RepID=A0ABR3KPX6_TRISP